MSDVKILKAIDCSNVDEGGNIVYGSTDRNIEIKPITEKQINMLFGIDSERLSADITCTAENTIYRSSPSISIYCPHCDESYYEELDSRMTAVYYPPIYKDGVNINQDRNITITDYKCLNCGKVFNFKR